jgi:hypothetical protein
MIQAIDINQYSGMMSIAHNGELGTHYITPTFPALTPFEG